MEEPARPRLVRLCIVALALVGVGNAWLLNSSNLIDDDAFIFFRYVDNMLAGHGLTWNPGLERVEGYTSFLYVFVLAIPRYFGADPVVAAHVLNVGLFAALLLSAAWLMGTLTRRWRAAVLLGPLLLATSSQFGGWARDGMETTLFATLIVLALTLHLRASGGAVAALLSGIVFGLTALARPEGLMLYVICEGWNATQNRREGRPMFGKESLLRLAGLLLLVAPHLLWRQTYYGEWAPNTYYAKVGFTSGQIERGVKGLFSFLASFQGILAALALMACSLNRGKPVNRLFVWLLAAWVIYLAVYLGLPRWDRPYAMPVSLICLLALGCNVGDVLARGGELLRSLATRAGLALGLLLILAGNLGPAMNRQLARGELGLALIDAPDNAVVNSFIVIGKRLRELARPGETVAVGACGAIPYYSGLITYDVLGLNDKHIARQPMPDVRTDAFGHEKGDGRYILDKRPTYLIPYPRLTPRSYRGLAGFERSFNEIFRDPEFRRDYEFRTVRVEGGRYFNYYQRKASAAAAGGE